jgi:signal transduction histidine kinase
MNLLRNAVQFTPEGGAVRLSCDGDAAGARIVVADSGAWHQAADQTRIFDRFQRSGSDGMMGGAAGGVGIGLPLRPAFVEAHGGTISCGRNGAKGSEFTIFLPRPAEPARPVSGPRARATAKAGAR